MSSIIEQAIPLPRLYYTPQSCRYWRCDCTGKWISTNEDMARKYAVLQGYSQKRLEEEELSPADHCLLRVQSEHNVAYAGPLAGYDAGFYNINGSSILVTESPKLIMPARGEWPLLQGIFEGMFVDAQKDQRSYIYGWLKRGLLTYHNHTWTQSQVCAFAGPVGSGKSLLQDLITKMFGGRSAKAHMFMTGGSKFNADLFGAEHLLVEDDQDSTQYDKRKEFGAQIKQIAVNQKQHCHGKHKDALSLTPRWRMTISLNDTPISRLQVLPPMEGDIKDKIMLFKIGYRPMPMPTETDEERLRFEAALEAELPAFSYFLMNEWSIPEDLRSNRYGIQAFHHPDLMASLDEFRPEKRLLSLIDQEYFGRCLDRRALDMTAAQIQSYLTQDSSSVRRQAESLLKYSSMCGVLLSNLCQTESRVSKRLIHGTAKYTIQPPIAEEGTIDLGSTLHSSPIGLGPAPIYSRGGGCQG